MAQITGSSAIDWSGISLAQVDFETDIVLFVNRVTQILEEPFTIIHFASSTLIDVTLVSGGRLMIGGSGLNTFSPVITSFNYNNPAGNGEVVRFSGNLDGIGNDVLTSITFDPAGSSGYSQTISGNISIPPTFPDSGSGFGTVSSLVATIGSTTLTLSGNFSVTVNSFNAELTGTVTTISVVSGTNAIQVTGLLLSLDAVEAALGTPGLDTVDDLFSFLSNHLPGNDVITYTNNSAVGITVHGGDGNDTLTVNGPNADTLVGGTGDDTFVHVAGGASDAFEEDVGGGTDTVKAAVTFTLPDASQNIENLTLTGTGNINGTGNTDHNVITGNAGANMLDGGLGNDTLNGGAGADNLQGGADDDIILLASTAEFAPGEVIDGDTGSDTLRFTSAVAGTLTLTGNVTNLEAVQIANAAGLTTGMAAINVNAATVANALTITGNNGANILTGTGLADTLVGNAGNDLLNGGAGNDTAEGGLGNDTFNGGVGEDSLQGGDGNDVFLFAVDDSGAGEVVEGGAGVDTLRFTATSGTLDLSGTVAVESVAIATAAGATTGTTAVNLNAANVTNALSLFGNNGANQITGTAFDDVLMGNAGNDTLLGLAGKDTLDGGLGADSMSGGLGDDTYVVENLDGVFELAGEGTDTVRINRTVDLNLAPFTEIENVVLLGAAALNATGDGGDNVLTGNAAANVLNGGEGDDTLLGGLGNDTYGVDAALDVVTEAPNAGTDLVQSAVAYILGANLENLTLTGVGDVDGTGNALNNAITGNGGNNSLAGDAGNDTLNGGEGDDTLLGGLGNDMLVGGNGADSLDGGAGTDNMAGGAGNDSYTVEVASDVVTEALNAGTDKVFASFNYTLGANLEDLELTGGANLNGTGNTLGNVLTGNSGNNLLSGLAGNDTLLGGLGNDTLDGGVGLDSLVGGEGNDLFVLDMAADIVVENSGAGSDTVRLAYNVPVMSGLTPFPTLIDLNVAYGGNVENVLVTGTGSFMLTGNAADNSLIGNGSINILDGGAGNDTLIGGAGADNQQGGAGNDLFLLASTAEFAAGELIDGGDGSDTLRYTGTVAATLTLPGSLAGIEQVQVANAAGDTGGIAAINVNAAAVTNGLNLIGNNGANILTGTAQADTINGNGGNDTINGGASADSLSGGEGNDTLIWDPADASVAGGAGTDTLRINGAGVTVDLTGNSTVTGIEVINLTGTGANSLILGAADVLAITSSGNLRVDGNAGDSVTLGSGWTQGANQVVGGITYRNYTQGGATVLVNTAIPGTVPVGDFVALTGDPLIDGLVQGGAWKISGSSILTYSLDLNFDGATMGWSFDWINAIDGAFAVWESVLDVDFVRVGTPGALALNQSTANIAIALAPGELGILAGLAIFPDPQFANGLLADLGYSRTSGLFPFPRPEGDIAFDSFAPDFFQLQPGSVGFEIILHEIGHALGLKHSDDDGGNGRQTFDQLGIGDKNTTAYTIMGSNVASGTPASTPMLLDILAAQHIYGANMSFNAGDDTYVLGGGFRTIWDTGGTDTIDPVGTFTPWTIDLREGHFSGQTDDVLGAKLAIAYGVTIENAVGGHGNDVIIGNNASNMLAGGIGADTISGGLGEDTLDGGGGADTLSGGDDDDIYFVNDVGDLVVENANEGIDTVFAAFTSFSIESLPNLEHITLTGAATANATGNGQDNELTGNSAVNLLTGNGGNDHLDGGAGIDTMIGGTGDDTFVVMDQFPGAPPTGLLVFGNGWLYGGPPITRTPDNGVFDILTVGDGLDADTLVDSFFVRHLKMDEGLVTGFFTLSISTQAMGENLAPGTFLNATRFGSVDGPALDMGFDGRGSNQLTGSLTIHNIDVDYSGATPQLESISFDFEIHSEGAVEATFGTFNWNMPAGLPTPETVTELPDEGVDTVQSALSYSLGPNVENLTLIGTDDINGTGNELDNSIAGNDGANTLDGGAGGDQVTGGVGADSINLGPSDTAADAVIYNELTEGAAAGANTGFDTVSGFQTGMDKVRFASNAKTALDDITADDSLAFATNAAPNFTTTNEALLRTGVANADLTELDFVTLLSNLNTLGVTAGTDDDGLIVAQGATQTGIYYYLENGVAENEISASELSLLAIVNGQLGTAEFDLFS